MIRKTMDFKWKTSKNSKHVGSRWSSDQILEIDDLWPMQVFLKFICLDREHFQRCRVERSNLKFFRGARGFLAGVAGFPKTPKERRRAEALPKPCR